MAIKHKHMSETVDDMTTGWRRILIGSGFFLPQRYDAVVVVLRDQGDVATND